MTESVDPFEGEFEEPETSQQPLSQEERKGALDRLAELASEGKITTASALLAQQEEEIGEPIPPEEGGPNPPGGLKYDFAWEREAIPHEPADREREKIRDTSMLVPLPLSGEAVAEWAKSQVVFLLRREKRTDQFTPGMGQDYDYLFRKGHVGALERLYPGHSPGDFAALVSRHGFTEEQSVKAGRRREGQLSDEEKRRVERTVVVLSDQEAEHVNRKETFSKAYTDARKKRGEYVAPPRKGDK